MPAGNVLTNDTLGDGTAADNTATLNDPAIGSYGTIALAADGSYTYTLDNTNPLVQQLAPGETLTETYNYTLADKDGDTSTSTLTITITGTDDLPVAAADTATIAEDLVDVTGNVITNDTLGDGTPAENVSTLNDAPVGSFGTIALGSDGSYTYTLDNTNAAVQQLAPGETLSETYDYTLTDKDGDTSVATLTITITGTDDLPVAAADTATIAEDLVDVTGNVITNDTLGDGTAAEKHRHAERCPAMGSLWHDRAGQRWQLHLHAGQHQSLVQQLAPGETLTESYGYTLTDKDGDTSTSTLTITITGTDDLPVAVADTGGIILEDDGRCHGQCPVQRHPG